MVEVEAWLNEEGRGVVRESGGGREVRRVRAGVDEDLGTLKVGTVGRDKRGKGGISFRREKTRRK